MPYYVYKIFPFRRLEKVGEFPVFKDASSRAKALRREITAEAGCQVKVVFADSELHAEDLLSEVREQPPVVAEDD